MAQARQEPRYRILDLEENINSDLDHPNNRSCWDLTKSSGFVTLEMLDIKGKSLAACCIYDKEMGTHIENEETALRTFRNLSTKYMQGKGFVTTIRVYELKNGEKEPTISEIPYFQNIVSRRGSDPNSKDQRRVRPPVENKVEAKPTTPAVMHSLGINTNPVSNVSAGAGAGAGAHTINIVDAQRIAPEVDVVVNTQVTRSPSPPRG